MPKQPRMTDARFAALSAAAHDGIHSAEKKQNFVDFATFLEVFDELKAMREERK